MEMNIDKKELVELCEEFINVPSPVIMKKLVLY